MIPRIKSRLGSLVTIIFFILLFVYFLNNQDSFKELLKVSIITIFLLVILKTLRIFINGLFTKFTLNAFGHEIGYKETNYLSLLSSMGNFFGPILGGASIRAVYLKNKFRFKYATFLATIYGFYLISFMTTSLIGLLALGDFYIYHGHTVGLVTMTVVMATIFLGTSFMIILPSEFLIKIINNSKFLPIKLRDIFLTMIEGWEIIRIHKRLLLQLSVLNIVIIFIAVIESYILYGLFSNQSNITSILIYTIFGTLSLLVSFTPGAIGIKESIFFFTSSIIMLSNDEILQMAAVDRSATFLLLTILFVIYKTSSKFGESIILKIRKTSE